MAPPPEYDKEPKAPDKSDTNIASDELLHSLDNDQHPNLDNNKSSMVAAAEVENNKHVEALDDGQLRALLDEAITYKNPKDREGKSSLFKELLEEVEVQDEQACEEAARTLSGVRGGARRGRGRRALAHSSSMQDLVAAALAAEPAPRRRHAPAPAPHSVSAHAIHGGSLPSGVDTSSLVCEEPARGGYLATVRCVNPPPLAERRVSASDANAPNELELLNRKNKPLFPMTYTARATLEIGSGSVSSGRAVTTTTASNQVTGHAPPPDPNKVQHNQTKLLKALRPKKETRPQEAPKENSEICKRQSSSQNIPTKYDINRNCREEISLEKTAQYIQWTGTIDSWYKGLSTYNDIILNKNFKPKTEDRHCTQVHNLQLNQEIKRTSTPYDDGPTGANPIDLADDNMNVETYLTNISEEESIPSTFNQRGPTFDIQEAFKIYDESENLQKYTKKRKGLVRPNLSSTNPTNIRRMTIGNPVPLNTDTPKRSIPSKTDHSSLSSVKKLELKTVIQNIDTKTKPIAMKEDLNIQSTKETVIEIELKDFKKVPKIPEVADLTMPNCDIELKDFTSDQPKISQDSFQSFVNNQYRLLDTIEEANSKIQERNNNIIKDGDESTKTELICQNNVPGSSNSEMELSTIEESISDSIEDKLLNQNAQNIANPIQTNEDDATKKRVVLGQLSSDPKLVTLPAFLPSSKVTKPFLALVPYSEGNNDVVLSKTGPKIKTSGKKDPKSSMANIKNIEKMEGSGSNSFTVLLIENLFKNYVSGTVTGAKSSPGTDKVDSAISFSCITTPEVVSGCNTTPSAPQPTVAVDSKPTSNFNGLALTRHSYSAAPSAAEEFKKSLDENGNSVQGFSSPLTASSQHKKPRRKKSSKNETVIDCQQMDGYQGDKDVNELLRFIESEAEPARAKLRKHRDDADDKHKKRCERRKDKDKAPRAASLEELSRTSLADLTAPAPAPPPRPAPPPAPPAPPAPELTDFQTVTKRRRARRRADEAGRPPPARPPPRADRSPDSTEDTDGASPPPAAPAVSYAEILRARTIPDLISSCQQQAARAGRGRRRPPDVLAGRPPVVLRDPPRALPGVTFGFELNEQLLRAPALRYVAPPTPTDAARLQPLVDYVGAAWEDVVRCGGEVRYFGE